MLINKLILILLILLIAGCNHAPEQVEISSPAPTPIEIEKIVINSDKDGDGILDLDDIVEGARGDVANKSKYKDAYYSGGYPPEDEGVCTDLIWRAFQNAGYDLKTMMDIDIKENESKYPRITGAPDPNIDFRRVPNHIVFFSRFGTILTKEVNAEDLENLKQWQGGDIVTIDRPQHIAIISDKRNEKGVPYVIHNMGPVPREEDCLESWNKKITGHFRYPKEPEE